ncbi:MAG: glycosyltransferase, partial [Chloroflexi bacterium]|nr:glycosyltransferase [Chloroflexota bacterium]
INNWAAYQVDADVLVFLNNDTEVIDPAWLDDLVGWALRPEVGVVGAKLLRPNGKIQHAGMIVGLMGHASHIFEDCDDHVYTHFGSVDWYRDYQAVTGACMAVRRNIFEELQGFDETYIVGYGDIDFCLRSIDAGYRVVYTPFAVLLHYEGGTRGLTLPPSDVLRASVKMFPAMEQGDGYFNPNLSYSSRQPVVRHLQEEPRGERLVRIMREFGLIGAGMGMTEWQDTLLSIPSQILSVDVPRNLIRGQSFSRLLIVTHELTRSGAPIILWMLAKYLKQHGHAVQVISPTDGPLKDDFLQQDIPVTVVPRLLEDARVSIPFLDDIQMVLCNTILTWRVVYAARAFARPCLWWVHESDFGVKLAAKNRSIGRAFEAATQVVFPSRTTKLQYQQFSRYNNLSALLTGFDVNTTITVDEPLFERNDHDLHLVCVATLEPRKGQDILLDAMADLPADVAAHTHCYLIGRTNIDTVFSYKIRWRSWWMKNIHLIGELPNDRVKQYLRQACVFVLSSRDEALPLALIEAMALRKPIISTDAGGISEIIRSGQNGYVVDVEDSHALAECITTLYRQPELLHHLGQQAQKDYQAFHTIAHFGEQMLQLLQDTYTHSIKI